jgi:hypothetical protein
MRDRIQDFHGNPLIHRTRRLLWDVAHPTSR